MKNHKTKYSILDVTPEDYDKELPPALLLWEISDNDKPSMTEWLSKNCIKIGQTTWRFENLKDVTYFRLRWSNDS